MAASGTAVTVLTPNGRRQTVKVSPNTPLLQVLEDVCIKHGFSSEDHGLKFQRTVLDLTLQWRFANLPNNAKLEMVPSTKKTTAADSQVRIALQMEDGSRLQGSFSSGQSLWELLTHFPQISVLQLSESGAIPVCVYMRDEVAGEEALKNATLKSLGLTGGSAIVRFLIKRNKMHEEQNGEKPIEPTSVAPAPVENIPHPVSRLDPAPLQPERLTPDEPSSSTDRPKPIPPTANTDDATCPTSSVPEQQDKGMNSQDAVRPKEPLVPMSEVPCCSSSTHALSAPSALPTLSAPFIPFFGGGQRLGGPGGAASVQPSWVGQGCVVESPKAKKPKSSHKSNSKPEVCHEEDMGQAEEFLESVERESLVYHMDCQLHHSNDTDLPDEFFEVTVDDVRKRFAQLKSERKLLEEAPLMTKALREAQMREKMQRYPKVVLRIQFPDRHVLQGFFRPLETVGAVRQFVRSHLEDPQLSFYLFITPPKTILKDSSVTLYQADLFPGAVVYFGSDVKTDTYLKTELLDSSVSASQANRSLVSILPSQTPPGSSQDQEEPEPSPEQNMDTSEPSHEEPPSQSQAPKPRPDPGKVPKWLKLPGKK
ncbi:tether containing UBX domain for GLUT4 [Periophthalmus magnuspinnatus]|uniref:tether containing UBX domain for GLUT4 n=1 Tax=Periophthalmus magnuspinnatus TaxID=409849 RepID=UPI00243649A6|nr:tether containing UBX domain for GLUT4 [Periophthalmus magnuspinnatus]